MPDGRGGSWSWRATSQPARCLRLCGSAECPSSASRPGRRNRHAGRSHRAARRALGAAAPWTALETLHPPWLPCAPPIATLLAGTAGLPGAAVAVLLLLGTGVRPLAANVAYWIEGCARGVCPPLHSGLHRRLERQRLAGNGKAPFGVGAHLVQGGLVGAADLLAVGAGLGARVDHR